MGKHVLAVVLSYLDVNGGVNLVCRYTATSAVHTLLTLHTYISYKKVHVYTHTNLVTMS